MPPESTDLGRRVLLLGSVFVVAACGLAYELIAAAVSSYLLGDAVTRFSLCIGVFLCAMGLGSHLSRYVVRDLVRTFVAVEVWIALVGGLSSMAMFAVAAGVPDLFPVFFYTLCAIIGALVGLEIPLLVRILRESAGWNDALSSTLALDYVGALAGSVLFPLVALPFLGISRASVVFGILNLVVAAVGTRLVERPGRLRVALAGVGVVLVVALGVSARVVGFLEDLMYEDAILHAESTPYQRIVLTRWRTDVRLFLDGHIQFSAVDEARYHEPLVVPAMESAAHPARVLLLGAGDGLAAREILKYPHVTRVDLVDLDPAMTTLARERPELRALNGGSLDDPRVHVTNTDAMTFLAGAEESWDVVIIDLPDPHSDTLARLYSRAFYTLALRRLSAGGALVTQATSPFYAPEAYWSIVATIEAAADEGTKVVPYHVTVPSFGEWGFVLASRRVVDVAALAPSVPTRYLNAALLPTLFVFGEDGRPPPGVQVNELDQPVVAGYYRAGWARYNE